ncbi:MAG: hypothetical protein ACTHOD_14005 [Motilibacteraceae bacterium]
MRRGRAAVLAVALGALTAAPAAAAEPAPRVVRHLSDPRIGESSSLVPSAVHPGVWWTSNDSGGNSKLYAVGKDGRAVATYTVGGAPERDWEAMAPAHDAAGKPAFVVGDIGDNGAERSNGILLHVVAEPTRLTGGTLDGPQYRLRYEDGPHDAESLIVDAPHHRVLVVTKELLGGAFFAGPWPLPADRATVLHRVADAPALATDAALLPDGRIVVRNYYDASVFSSDLRLLGSFALPEQPQGESLAVAADGRSLLVGSEGEDSAVWQVPLPAALAVRPTSSPAPRPGAAQPPAAAVARTPRALVGGAAALVALLSVGALVVTRRRRPRS